MLFFGGLQVEKKQPEQTTPAMQLPRAEFPAEFPTGQAGYNNWFDKHTQALFDEMSEEEIANCATFRVHFLVKKDGSINDVHILNAISKTSKQKMEAVFYRMPKWRPATTNGKPVDYLCKISGCIQFQ